MVSRSRKFYGETIFRDDLEEEEREFGDIYLLKDLSGKTDKMVHYMIIGKDYENNEISILRSLAENASGDTFRWENKDCVDPVISANDFAVQKYYRNDNVEGVWKRRVPHNAGYGALFPTDLSAVLKHPGSNPGVTIHDVLHPSQFLMKNKNTEDNRFHRELVESKHVWIPETMRRADDGQYHFREYVRGSLLLEEVFQQLLPDLRRAWTYAQVVKMPPQDYEDSDDIAILDLLEAKDIRCEDASDLPDELQVYLKIVDIELEPDSTHSGVWHLEGLPDEHIVATGIYYFPCNVPSQILFKRHHSCIERSTLYYNTGQGDHIAESFRHSYMPLGTVHLPSDETSGASPEATTLVFPNTHIHRVLPCYNDTEEEVHRKAVIFFLVDPAVPIETTCDVVDTRKHPTALKNNMEARMKEKGNLQPLEINFCEH